MGLFFNKNKGDEVDKGLLGVSAFLESLRKDLLDNKSLRKLYDLRRIKAEAEILILKKEFTNPKLEEYQNLLSKNDEGKLLYELRSKYQKPVARIIPVLLKIKERERYKNSWKTTELLINILNFVFETKFLKNLEKKLAIESKAIRKNNFDIFLREYQEEKILLMDFHDYLKEIGGDFIADEIVRAGYNFESAEKSFFSSIKSDLTKGSTSDKLFIGTVFSVLCAMFVGGAYIDPVLPIVFATGLGLGGGFIKTIEALDRRDSEKLKLSARSAMYAVLDEVSKRADEWTKNTVELAKEIAREYDILISGNFLYYDLVNLRRALKQYYPEEVKRFLSEVVYIDTLPKEFVGLHYPNLKKIELYKNVPFNVIDHELAHARTNGLPDNFVKKWEEINNKGVPYDEAQKLATKGDKTLFVQWSSDGDGNASRYGYAGAYGVNNISEDIATFTELIVLLRGKNLENYFVNLDVTFTEFIPIYIAKLQLLYKFGLVTKEDVERLLTRWKSIE